MRALLILLALLTTFVRGNPPAHAAEELSFDEIRAGYLKNRDKFAAMRVTYRWQSSARSPETDEFTFQATDIDLWADGKRMQVRSPRLSDPETSDKKTEPAAFTFPDSPVTPATLLTDYQRIAIWSHEGEPASLVRQWHGGKFPGSDSAGRVGKDGNLRKILGLVRHNLFLPAMIASPADSREFTAHPYDDFFLTTLEQRRAANQEPGKITERVVGREQLGKHDTIVIERCMPVGGINEKKYPAAVGRLHMVLVDKVWIDPARGFLPLRYERWHKPALDGVLLTREGDFAPFFFETGAITQHGDDAYYPTEVTLRQLVAIRQASDVKAAAQAEQQPDWISELLTTGKLLPNLEKPRLERETTWRVSQLTLAPAMPDEMFALQFPRGTVYHDEHFGRTVVNGQPADSLLVDYINNWLTAAMVVSEPLLPLLEHLPGW